MKQDFKNIIIRMPNWLGDAVMATPLIEDIRNRWPNAKIAALCKPAIASLLSANPHLDECISFTDKKEVIPKLRKNKYDLGILLTNSFSSAFEFWRGKVKERVGFSKDLRRFLLTKPLAIPKEKGKEHLVITFKRLLEPLGVEISKTEPKLYLSEEEKRGAKKLLLKYGIPEDALLVGINPGAAYGSAKCWLPDRFKMVTQKLLENRQVHILFFADGAGASLVHSICEGLPERVIDLGGKTSLRELVSLIASCDVFLTNDSGPMHVAASLKTPLVALFGSTNEIATGPYGHGKVIHKHVPCSPCYKRTCPIDFPCMKKIEVNEVYMALKEQLIKGINDEK